MSSVSSDSDQKTRARIGLDRRVQLRFEKFQDFLTEIAANISTGGMFVRSDQPHEPGEQFEFECSLADGYPLVSGRAEVVWVRARADSNDRPSGMGVRFVELRDKSEALIRRIVEQRVQAGEKPFELAAEKPQETVGGTSPSANDSSNDRPATPPPAAETPPPEVQAGLASPVRETPKTAQAVESAPAKPSAPPPQAASKPTPRARPPVEQTRPAAPFEAPKVPIDAAKPPVSADSKTPPRRPSSASRKTASPPKPLSVDLPAASRNPEPPLSTASAPSSRSDPAAKAPPHSRAETAGRRKLGFVRFLELVLISGLAGAFMLLVFYLYWVRPRIENLEARLGELIEESSVESPAMLAQAETAALEVQAAEPSDAGEGDDIGQPVPAAALGGSAEEETVALTSPEETVRSWARAWSEQQVDDYLAYYSPDFVPASGLPRPVWEQRRRQRLLGQGAIRVAVVSLQVEEIAPDEITVTFTQSYRSNVYQDRVRKTLHMSWIDDRWQIDEEVVIRKLPW